MAKQHNIGDHLRLFSLIPESYFNKALWHIFAVILLFSTIIILLLTFFTYHYIRSLLLLPTLRLRDIVISIGEGKHHIDSKV
jgi:hypothetical protein